MPSSSDRVTEECRKGHEHFDTFPRKRDVLPILLEALNLKEDSEHFLNSITQKQISDLLKAQGHSILNENIITGEIKALGEFEITIKIYEDISSILKVFIEKR